MLVHWHKLHFGNSIERRLVGQNGAKLGAQTLHAITCFNQTKHSAKITFCVLLPTSYLKEITQQGYNTALAIEKELNAYKVNQ